ncbi:MAG: HAD-IIIA family hydrolase [Planctomycetota bacterium]|nr:HAD-IIIA family hydrolase [Planctomycetota bacterium]MDP6763688.1 HAD-IIIA family hydrolase [Planctomycetota bacterium]MDP6989479.1 HAD-IIIA family hydrolase [Planctomycetota bacterium]
MRGAVFLDRDGTLIVERDFLTDPEGLCLLPGAGEAVARLNAAGWAVVVVTNQSGIARGLLDERTLSEIHERLHADLAAHEARLDGVYHCPHHPEHGLPPLRADCSCRKPLPGLLELAARELGLDCERSWCVGDAERDLLAGEALGARSILVATGKGAAEATRMTAAGRPPERTAADLPAAVDAILAAAQASGSGCS